MILSRRYELPVADAAAGQNHKKPDLAMNAFRDRGRDTIARSAAGKVLINLTAVQSRESPGLSSLLLGLRPRHRFLISELGLHALLWLQRLSPSTDISE